MSLKLCYRWGLDWTMWLRQLNIPHKVPKTMFFYSKSSLHGHVGVHFDVKGWRPKIDKDIFEEPKNSPIF